MSHLVMMTLLVCDQQQQNNFPKHFLTQVKTLISLFDEKEL